MGFRRAPTQITINNHHPPGPDPVERRSNRTILIWTAVGAVAGLLMLGLAVVDRDTTAGGAATSVATTLSPTSIPTVPPSTTIDEVVIEGPNNGQICTDGSTCQITPAETRPTRDISALDPCPLPDPTAEERTSITVCVAYWCKAAPYDELGRELPDQHQVKVRVVLTNMGAEPIDISTALPSRIRLLVRGQGLDERWNPRPGTVAYGDRPFLVEHDGDEFWAIAPNQPFTEVPAQGGSWTGFATSWTAPAVIEPQQVIGSFDPRDESTNLVFEVPWPEDEDIGEIYGLALIAYEETGAPRVIGFDYAVDWPDPVHASTF